MATKNKKFLKFYVLAVLAGAAVLVWLGVWRSAPTGHLKTVFFDIGQGDAIFLETPARRQVLIDGGPSQRILAKLAAELGFWDDYIDVVILTHPDADHISGLIDVLKRYQIGIFLHSGITRSSLIEYQEIWKIIEEKKIPALAIQQGSRLKFGDGVGAEILWPPPGAIFSDLDTNRSSLVSRFSFGSKSFLFMADAETREERDIVALAGTGVKADVLKVGHHGSKNASSWLFLEAVRPAITVISVGKNNRYHHPHLDVLGRLEEIGSQILRTDLLGNIKILTDGLTLKILSDRI